MKASTADGPARVDCELLSIDIFDTLLLRLVDRPVDVFQFVGTRAIERGWIDAVDQYVPERKRAQQEARRKSPTGEITLQEIYNCMPLACGKEREWAELELGVEKELCFLNPVAMEWILDAATRKIPIVLASDMYFDSAQLRELLVATGVPIQCFSGIYVSCESAGDKASGRVFQRIFQTFPAAAPGDMLHVGDSPTADVQAAQKAGMEAVLYRTRSDYLSRVIEYERTQSTSSLMRLNALRAVSCGREDAGIDRQFGAAVLGPLLTAFCETVLDRADRLGIELLCSFTREASVISPVLRAAIQKRGSSLKVVDFEVSRASTFLAALRKWDSDAVEDLMDGTGATVGSVLAFLGIEVPGILERMNGVSLRGELSRSVRDALGDYLMSPPISGRIEQKMESSRFELLSYGESKFEDKRCIGMLDMGFRGTISRALDRVLVGANPELNLWHWLMFATSDIERMKGEGLKIEGVFSGPKKYPEIAHAIRRSSFFLEQLLTGVEGSCLSYRELDGNWVAVRGEAVTDEETIRAKNAALAGILEFQRNWLTLREVKGNALNWDDEALDAVGRSVLRSVEYPLHEEAEAWGKLVHDFNSSSGSSRSVILDADLKIWEESDSSEDFLNLAREQGVHWPQGVLALKDEDAMKRAIFEGGSSVQDSYEARLYRLSQEVVRAGYGETVIYGAGDAGRSMLNAARLAELKVLGFVDRKESLWGSEIEGIGVFSLSAAISQYPHAAFLVGSFAFAEDIERTIQSANPASVIFRVGKKKVDL